MYIEFKLPHGISTRVMSEAIKAAIAVWADKHGVPQSGLSQKTIKNTHRLSFNNEKYFTLFSMTWNQYDFQIVNIANERY